MDKESNDPLLRRKYPRRYFRRKLGILFNGKYWLANGLEIGEGGVSFTLGQALAEGKMLVINLQVPGGNFISVQGEIRSIRKDVRSGQYAHGIVFRTLKFEHKREIRTYVSARKELEQ